MDFVPAEKGVPIRQPATANLMIDSADRNTAINPSPYDFQITKTNSILNGFFTRIGTTEVVLEWNEPNGAILEAVSTTFTRPDSVVSTVVTTFNQFEYYTVADAIGAITSTISTAGGDISYQQGVGLASAGGHDFNFDEPLTTVQKLCVLLPDTSLPSHPVQNPDLRPFRYLDFVSQQLTYNQDLKDNATNTNNRDVLCRWYMSWDNQPDRDSLGFPILMGYEPFKLRRLFNPPKQIKWEPNMPIGNLSFQVCADNNAYPIDPQLASDCGTEWLMTLQVSET